MASSIHIPNILILTLLLTCLGCSSPEKTAAPLQEFGLSYLGEIEAIPSSAIDKAPWGIHFNGMPFHDMTFAQYDSLDVEGLLAELPVLIEETNALGVKWARISVDWGLIEDNEGEFHWELLDPTINGLVEKGIEVYPSLHAGHAAYTDKRPPVAQVEINAWLNFVEKVVDRYKDQITYWEIWNEPNTTWFWGTPNAAEYTALVKASAELIRRVDPECKIIGGSLARLDVPYAEELFALGIAEHIDVFSFHPYGVFPEAALKKMDVQVKMPLLYKPVMNPVEGLQKLIAASGKEIALWQGECGYPSAMNGGGWNGTGPYSEQIQAKWILRRAFTDLSFDADVSAYFMLKENKHPHYDFYNYKGLLEFHELERKEGFEVFQNLTAVVQGDLRIDTSIKITPEVLADGELYGIRPKNIRSVALQTEAARLIAYWGVVHMQSRVKPGRVSLQLEGLKDVNSSTSFELLDVYNGKVYQIEGIEMEDGVVECRDVPLGDYPFVVRVRVRGRG